MTLSIWPVELGDVSRIVSTIDAGSDVTCWVDYGTTDLEEMFLGGYLNPCLYNYTYASIGSYEVTVSQSNNYSYFAKTAYALVDYNFTDGEFSWAHTIFGSPTYMNVSGSNGTRITVFWDMDNGFGMENYASDYTALSSLSYPMTELSFLETRVWASNSLSFYSEELLIAVMLECSDFNITTVIVQNISETVTWERTLSGCSNLTCLIDYGDGALNMTYEPEPGTDLIWERAYNETGTYNWSVICSNLLNTFEANGSIVVEIPMTDLASQVLIYFLFGGDLLIYWDLSNGTDVTFEVTFNQVDSVSAQVSSSQILYPYGNGLNGRVTIPEADYQVGDWEANITGYNLVSRDMVTVSIIIDRMILNLTVEPSTYFQRPEENITLDIAILDGSRPEFRISWGDPTSDYLQPTQDIVGPAQFDVSHAYAVADKYTITLSFYNNLVFMVRVLEVCIENPVDGSVLDHNNVTVPTDDVRLTITYPTLRPTFAQCSIDFQDGDTTDVDLDNSTATFELDAHFFPYDLYYNVSTYCWNNVSNITFYNFVRVGVEIEGASLVGPGELDRYWMPILPPDGFQYETPQTSDMESYIASRDITFTYSIELGSNVYYETHFGDGVTSGPILRSVPQTDYHEGQITHSYNFSDVYSVYATFQNNLSAVPFTAYCCEVFAQNVTTGLTWDDLPTQNLNTTCNTTFTLSQNSSYPFPTNASCHFDYADGNFASTLLIESGGAHRFNHSYLYNISHGWIQPVVNCSNDVSWQLIRKYVLYQFAIVGLDCYTPNHTVEVAHIAEVNISMDQGSHVNISVDFPGNNSMNLVWNSCVEDMDCSTFNGKINGRIFDTTFPEGNYTTIVNAMNHVSDVTVICTESFIIQYTMPPVVATSRSPYLMNTYGANVSIDININPSVNNGPTDAHCNFTYDLGQPDVVEPSYAASLRDRFVFIHNHTYIYISDFIGRVITVTVNCTNCIQFSFCHTVIVLQEEIAGLNVTAIRQLPNIGELAFATGYNITFTIVCTNGTHAEAHLQFGDGTFKKKNMSEPWSGFATSQKLIYKVYSMPANRTVIANVSNDVSYEVFAPFSTYQFIIQDVVPNVTAALSHFHFSSPNCMINWNITMGPPMRGPTDPSVTINITMLDSNYTLSNYYFAKSEFDTTGVNMTQMKVISKSEPIPDRLTGAGVFHSSVFNLVSNQNSILYFEVQEEFEELNVYTSKSQYRINENVTVYYKLGQGSHANFTIYLGDGQNISRIHENRLNSTSLQAMNYSFPLSGNYSITVVALNHIHTLTGIANTTQIVMAPVDNLQLEITNRNSLGKISSPPGIIDLRICNPDHLTDISTRPDHVYINITFRDASTTQMRYHDFASTIYPCYNYSHVLEDFSHGELQITIQIANLVSNKTFDTTVDVMQVTDAPLISTNYSGQCIPSPFNIAFNCSSAKGSNLSITIDYKDDTDTEMDFFVGVIDYASVEFYHQYQDAGNYSVTCNFTNEVSTNLTTLDPVLILQRPIMADMVQIIPDSDFIPVPPGVIDWTLSFDGPPGQDVHISTNNFYKFATEFPLTFNTSHNLTGEQNITFKLENVVCKNVTITKQISFQQAVSAVDITAPEYVALNTSVKINCTRETGSHVSVNLLVENEEISQTYQTYQDNFQEVASFDVGFNTPGLFSVMCEISNNVSAPMHQESIVYALSLATSLFIKHSMIVASNTPNIIQVFTHNTYGGVTRANVSLTFPDNSTDSESFLDPDAGFLSVNLTKSFTQAGIYSISAEVRNELSMQTNNSMIEVRDPITNLSITTQSDNTLLTDFSDINKFSVLTFSANSYGSNVTYQWNLTGTGSELLSLSMSEGGMTAVSFDEAGTFTIILFADNIVSNDTITLDLTIRSPLKIHDFSCAEAPNGFKVGTEQECTVTLLDHQDVIGLSCIQLSFTSNRTINLPSRWYAASSDLCPDDDVMFDVITIDPAVDEQVISFNISNEVEPLYLNLTVIAEGSSDVASVVTTALSEPCVPPSVTNIGLEGSSGDQPQTYLKSALPFTLRASVVFNREGSCSANHTEIHEFIVATGNLSNCDGAIDSNDATSIEIEDPSEYIYGVYVACYTKKYHLNNGREFYGTGYYFFRIAASDLSVGFGGGADMEVGAENGFELEATLVDPDNEDLDGVYQWSCVTANGEACFRPDEVNLVSFETESMELEVDENKLTFKGTLTAGSEFIVTVIASKGERQAEAQITIRIVEGTPKTIDIACQCIQVDDDGKDQKVNFQNNPEMCQTCSDCTAEDGELTFEMTAMCDSEPVTLTDNCAGDCAGSCKVLDVSECKHQCVTVTTEMSRPGKPSNTKNIKLRTADEPHGGTCSCNPTQGQAMKTEFTVTCTGWDDGTKSEDPCTNAKRRRKRNTDNALGLTILYFHRKSGGEETPMATATDVFLPSGNEEDDFELTVIAVIVNELNIEARVEMLVRVEEAAEGAEEEVVAGIPSGNPSKDVANMAALFATVGSGGSSPGSNPGGVPQEDGEEEPDNGAILAKMINSLAGVLDSDPDPETVFAMMTMVSKATKDNVQGAVSASDETIELMLKMSSSLGDLDDEALQELGGDLMNTLGREVLNVDNAPTPAPPPTENPDAVPNELEEEAAEQRRLEEQKALLANKKNIAASMEQSTRNMAASLSKNLIEGVPITVGNADLLLSVQLKRVDDLGGSEVQIPGGGVVLPAMDFNRSGDDLIIFDVTFSRTNVFSWTPSSDDVTSGTTSMDLSDQNGNAVPFGELQDPLQLTMGQDEGKDNFADMANATVDKRTNLIYLYVPVVDSAGAYILDVDFDDFDTPENLCFDIYVKFNVSGEVSLTNRPGTAPGSYDWNATIPDTGRFHPFILVIPERFVGRPGLSIGFLPRICEEVKPLNTTPVFKVASAFTRCRSWSRLDEEWTKESCAVDEEKSTLRETKCSCNKLNHDVKTFAGGITVPQVNAIDFSNVFANFGALLSGNPTGLATLLAIFVVYILLLVWARRKDKQDTEKWGVTPLVDNLPGSACFYKLSVYTGLRRGAGTQSKVCFILAGDRGDTGVRVMDDGRGKHFERGSVRHFIMSINEDLGPLNYLRIWHDNSGEGVLGSWYLDKVTVEDLGRRTRHFFLNSRWLSVEEEDGMVDRSLPVAGDEEIDGFDHIFFSSARHNLTDEHLWISVLSRPTKSNFTRSQRLTCCLTLLYTTMIASAMWYKDEGEDTGQDQVISIGPIKMSVQILLISIFANLTVVPINIIIVQLYRKSKPRYYVDMAAAKKAKRNEENRQKQLNANLGHDQKKSGKEGEKKPGEEDKEKGKCFKGVRIGRYPLPWWCIYVAWTLAVISCAICAFFVLLYTLQWGKLKSEKWLSALIFSFVQSVLIVQPIKVIAVAMILSCIFKKYKDEEDDDDVAKARLQDDEEALDIPTVDLNTLTAPAPPSSRELRDARDRRARNKRMWATLKEALVYLLFLLLVAFIAWGPRDGNAYGMVTNIKQMVRGDNKAHGDSAGETTSQMNDGFKFWQWVNTTVVEAMYNTRKYNGQPTVRRDRRYISDGVSFRVGPVRLRQLRIKPAGCTVEPIMRPFIIECNVQYGITTEEDRNFTEGWGTETVNSTLTTNDLPFRFHSMLELNGFPIWGVLSTFGGGGYIADLKTSPLHAQRVIQNLINTNWVDYYTRAVFLEFTVFNPNVNLFAHTSFLVEFPLTGSTLTIQQTHAFQVYSALGGMGTAVLVAQIVYILVMVYFMYMEIKEFKEKGKKEYFADPWNIYEVIVIIASIVCIAMFAMKEVFGRLVTNQLKASRDGYSSYLQLATYIELVDYTVGFIVFMANIKFLRLLRFNTHVRELGKTFHVAGKELLYFAATFFIMYMAFNFSGTLLFGIHMYDFIDFIHTLQALYAIILGSTDLNSMRQAQPVLGPIYFFLYLTLVFFILVNMFVTILTNAYTEVRLAAKQDEDEILSFFMTRFKSAVGIAKPEKDIGAGYIEPADLLDRRIDSIHAWINQFYKEEAMAKKAGGKVSKLREKPLEGEISNKKSMFTF